MENNIHEDKLDDYVRQSFDDYEEEPSAGMWERVEAALPPAEERPKWRVAYLRYRWQAAAAAVILLLLSTLVCEHLYYEQRLRALSSAASDTAAFSPKTSHNEGIPQEKTEATSHAVLPPTTLTHPAEQQVSEKKTPQVAPAAQSSRDAAPLVGAPQRGQLTLPRTAPSAQAPTDGAATPKVLLTDQLRSSTNAAEKQQSTAASEQPQAAALAVQSVAPTASGDTASSSPTVFEKNLDLAEIAQRRQPLVAAPASHILPPTLPIKPRRDPSGWYIGAKATALAITEKSPTTITRPNGRPLFVSRQEASQTSAIAWLKVGKRLGKRFALESGAGYQKMEWTATHTPRFRFGDGTLGGNPGPGALRTFNYDLNTYGGTAEVTLRMEQTNPGTQPSGDEPVPLKITTTEQREWLRVPLVAAYQLGEGRWRSHLKAGLLGNFVLKNELDISTRVSQNARFRPVDGRGGYTVQLSDPGKFSLGYLLSVGAEHKFNRYLSLVAEPTLVGDFARQDARGQRLPEHVSMGLNVGLNLCF